MCFNQNLILISGKTIYKYNIIYENYGIIKYNNVILICHALASNHHAAGFYPEDPKPGWWNVHIGYKKSINTNNYFLITLNNLGGCHGSIGPNIINKKNNNIWGPNFPIITLNDLIKNQSKLAYNLGILKFLNIIGGSLGGMQVLEWSNKFPTKIYNAIIIASTNKLNSQNIAFNELARQSIKFNLNFKKGWFYSYNLYKNISKYINLARMLGHLTYLSEIYLTITFNRNLYKKFFKNFKIKSYLINKGYNFYHYFDSNSYIIMTKILDFFNYIKKFNLFIYKTIKFIQCRFLIISFINDCRFSYKRSKKLVNILLTISNRVRYFNVNFNKGHDGFLLFNMNYISILYGFINYKKNYCYIITP
ncbi:Homoserine O-acetyltransferase [Candidatus Johnevansia muelleri]|uniref:Homoserine O-succinyltransferase n=1 Tax=Candidatus Johnevansia muelleri TaxID=1495769 RepID=A0A078KE16_9GAMM|nr:Homoserine O-acetyltransferase [Candidatus Evansia muelleri]